MTRSNLTSDPVSQSSLQTTSTPLANTTQCRFDLNEPTKYWAHWIPSEGRWAKSAGIESRVPAGWTVDTAPDFMADTGPYADASEVREVSLSQMCDYARSTDLKAICFWTSPTGFTVIPV